MTQPWTRSWNACKCQVGRCHPLVGARHARHGSAPSRVTQCSCITPHVSQGRAWGPAEARGIPSPLGIQPMVSSKCTHECGGLGLWTGGTLLPSGLLPSFRLAQIPGLVNSVTASPEVSCLPSRTPHRAGFSWRPLHHARKVDTESDGSTEETDESET